MAKTRGHGRSVPGSERRGARTDKSPSVARKGAPPADPTVCDRCGATYTRKAWRFDHAISRDFLEKSEWGVCPACTQAEEGIAYGRVLLIGTFVAENLDAVRRRIDNVESRAGHTQPQRRILSFERTNDGYELLTTSQKLAHRISAELEKAFGGKTRYVWDDRDGSLLTYWTR